MIPQRALVGDERANVAPKQQETLRNECCPTVRHRSCITLPRGNDDISKRKQRSKLGSVAAHRWPDVPAISTDNPVSDGKTPGIGSVTKSARIQTVITSVGKGRPLIDFDYIGRAVGGTSKTSSSPGGRDTLTDVTPKLSAETNLEERKSAFQYGLKTQHIQDAQECHRETFQTDGANIASCTSGVIGEPQCVSDGPEVTGTDAVKASNVNMSAGNQSELSESSLGASRLLSEAEDADSTDLELQHIDLVDSKLEPFSEPKPSSRSKSPHSNRCTPVKGLERKDRKSTNLTSVASLPDNHHPEVSDTKLNLVMASTGMQKQFDDTDDTTIPVLEYGHERANDAGFAGRFILRTPTFLKNSSNTGDFPEFTPLTGIDGTTLVSNFDADEKITGNQGSELAKDGSELVAGTRQAEMMNGDCDLHLSQKKIAKLGRLDEVEEDELEELGYEVNQSPSKQFAIAEWLKDVNRGVIQNPRFRQYGVRK